MSQSSNENAGRGAATAELTDDDRHRLLRSERRRIALGVLVERALPVDLECLAAAIAEREANTDAPEDETVDRIALALHHNHLPMMADVGVIDYDLDSNRIVSFEVRPDSLLA